MGGYYWKVKLKKPNGKTHTKLLGGDVWGFFDAQDIFRWNSNQRRSKLTEDRIIDIKRIRHNDTLKRLDNIISGGR